MTKPRMRCPTAAAIAGLCLSISICGTFSGCSKAKKGGDTYLGEKAVTKQHELIEKHVSDLEKQARMLAILEDIQTAFEEFDAEVQKPWLEKRTRTFRDYNADLEEFERIGEAYDREFSALFDEILEKRFELKALSTPKEWKKIADR